MSYPINYRAMEPRDLPEALALTQAEKWPHQAADWSLHFSLGQGWVAEVNGRVVGTTLLWPYGAVSTVGLIVVDPAFQGNGIGGALLDKAMAANSAAQLRLVATQAGLKLYRREGFETTGLIRQCQGEPGNFEEAPLPKSTIAKNLSEHDLEELCRLDELAFGAPRKGVLESLLRSAKGVALTFEGQIQSFAFIREGGRGLQFGPIVATDIESCRYLISKLLPSDGRFTRIDITEQAASLLSWLDSAGLKVVDEVSAMTLYQQVENMVEPAENKPHTFALVSQAFG